MDRRSRFGDGASLAGLVTRGRRRPGEASSFHVWWMTSDQFAPTVSVDLTVLTEPDTNDLCFWALQIGFASSGAHLGLQWNPRHPGMIAVNFGGYHDGGGLLDGTVSTLPSTPDDPNTRDYGWQVGRSYRLSVGPAETPGWWDGWVTDLGSGEQVLVRSLEGGGSRLHDPVVWAEIFAPCDASTAVRWARPRFGSAPVTRGRVTYQERGRGGCDNTDIRSGPGGLVQETAVQRRTRPGSVVDWPD